MATETGGAPAYALVFCASLGAGLVLLRRVPRPTAAPHAPDAARKLREAVEPLRHAVFRRLLGLYAVSGIAASLPATLVLFFIRDRLAAPQLSGAFLFIYFGFAALGAPCWGRLVQRLGVAPAWFVGMLGSALVFSFAATLHAGDVRLYGVVCAASGLMLGADLILPPTLLADLIRILGHSGRLEGAYFGLWNMAAKLTLAIAAGVALPLLAALGYTPGTSAPGAFAPLVLAYCLLPAALKLAAAGLLWLGWMRRRGAPH